MQSPLSLVSQEKIVALTKSLVAIPSVTNHEQAISDWMFDHFNTLGLFGVQRLPVDDSGDTLIGWIDGPIDKPSLLFCFHMDTFAAFEGWAHDPFTTQQEGNRLSGLGTHDMKGGAACALNAVAALIDSGIELGGRIYVAATTDEENWSRGAHALINSGLIPNCMGCMIPEPTTAGKLTIGARGRHVFRLTFHGKTVHAAYSGGINAAVDAAKVVTLLADPTQVDLGYSKQFDLSGSLCVIGIESGGTLILVPERAEVYIDRHILPGQTVEEAAEQIRQVVRNANIEGTFDLAWDERPTPAPTSYVVPSESRFVQAVQRNLALEQGREIVFDLARSVADTNHMAVHGGIPTIICGPQGGNTCEANEFVLVDSMEAVARTYVRSALELLGS